MTEHSQKQIVQTVVEKVDAIPSLPQIVTRIINLVNNEDTSVGDVGRAIKTDPALSAQLLRFANARYYGHSGEINTVRRAITILGFNTVRSMVLSYGVEKHYTAPESSAFSRQEFWNYSLACAAASEIIAARLGYRSERKDQAFSAGHLHAIGKIILDQHLHREFIKVMQHVNREKIPMYEAEKNVLGTTHCEIGSSVLDGWNLPKILTEAARYYYTPGESEEEIVTIVHFASVLVKTKKYGFSGDYDISYLDEKMVRDLNIEDEAIENILQVELPKQYKELKDI